MSLTTATCNRASFQLYMQPENVWILMGHVEGTICTGLGHQVSLQVKKQQNINIKNKNSTQYKLRHGYNTTYLHDALSCSFAL